MFSKKVFTLLVFLFALTTIRAQYVSIPDTNFRNFLQANGFSACIQGNSLDTTCPAVLAATKINATSGSIRSISGIEYFKNLDSLITGYSYLDSISVLPDSLTYFSCTNATHMTELPDLPSTLLYLNCSNDSLTFLPALPAGLQILYCSSNYFSALPVLPSGLLELVCTSNSLMSLPALPATLNRLYCSYNLLATFPSLPTELDTIECRGMVNLQLPALLPDSLEYLDCRFDSLTTLPSLPPALKFLDCSNNQITSLPSLPQALRTLNCYDNHIASLPALPADLVLLYCGFNNLDSLPALPQHLAKLYCQNNNLTKLPALPDPYYFCELDCSYNNLNGGGNYVLTISSDWFLFYLNCSNNPLLDVINIQQPYPEFTYLNCSNCMLGYLPSFLYFDAMGGGQLICDHNYLSNISIPNYVSLASFSHNQIYSIAQSQFYGLNELRCDSNLLTTLPVLPETLSVLKIQSNPIECLPELQTITSFYWDNTDIHCLPNYGHITNAFPPLSTIGLCQPSDNCPSMWNIIGDVFFDADSNCTQGVSEISLKDIPVVLDSGGVELQRYLTDTLGRYSFRTGTGNYTIRIDTTEAPFRVACPVSFFASSFLTVADSMDTIPSFGLLCNTGFDLIAKSICPSQLFRPGFQNQVHLNAGENMSFSGVNCTSNVSGSVQAILGSLVSYVSPANGALTPSSVNGDTITWNIPDFSVVNPVTDFNVVVLVSVAATLNDSVCIMLSVLPSLGDNIPSNNFLTECYPVRGSFDPNEKYMSPSGIVDSSTQWFTFTVFFQNTGNAPAENIYILDTLDEDLDATTFIWLSSSHEVITQMLANNILRFNFPNINLIDSFTNEPMSHGFVQFKIKRIENPIPNSLVENTAHIFFDYNPPISTNEVTATLSFCATVSADFSSLQNVCPGACIDFQNLSVNAQSYQWFFPGANPDASTDENPTNICYDDGGYFPVTLISGCLNQSDTLTVDTFITVRPIAAFSVTDQEICPGECVTYTNLSQGGYIYQWSFFGGIPSVSTQQNPGTVCYQSPGSFNVMYIVQDSNCTDFLYLTGYITVFDPPELTITQIGDSLHASPGFVEYEWYLYGNLLTGLIDSVIYVWPGNYSVVCIDSNGCESTAAILNVMTDVDGIIGQEELEVYPNPAQSQLTVDSKQYAISSIEIRNLFGQEMYSFKTSGRKEVNINLSEYPNGVYFIKVFFEDGLSALPSLRKFIKQ